MGFYTIASETEPNGMKLAQDVEVALSYLAARKKDEEEHENAILLP